MKKQTWYGIGAAIITLACGVGGLGGMGMPPTPTQSQEEAVGTIVAATMQAFTAPTATAISATDTPTRTSGTPVTFEYASFIVPGEAASGANPELVPAIAADNGSPWEVAPAHLRFMLTGYAVQDKFHEPRILIYPAEEFAQAHAEAAEQIDRLRKALAGSPLLEETLPRVPFFNAGPLIAANIKLIPFQNGRGVRALTQYAQYSAPINNRELFYHFQGLTNDEKYYVIALLPITAPILPVDEKPEAVIPEGGVTIPDNTGPTEVYYLSVTEKLNSLAAGDYLPSLEALDALIGSILVTNP